MVTRPSDGIPVGLSIVLYLVSNVRNTLVILTPYILQHGLLYSQGRILIPPTSAAIILRILQQYHNSPLAGHYGVART